MFRFLLRRPRSIRVPVENGQVDIQKVEVKRKSKPIFRKYITNFIITFCVVRTLSYALSDDFKKTTTALGRRAEEIKKNRQTGKEDAAGPSDQWKQQHGDLTKGKDPINAISIEEILKGKDVAAVTLPVWFRERQRRLCTEEDWLPLADLQQDKKRFNDIKVKIAKDVTAQLRDHRHHANLEHIGFNKNVGVFLEIIPPIMTPVTYEVPCILITPQKLSFAWRPMAPAASTRTERIFHPVIFARAFGEGLLSFWQTSYLITKARLIDLFTTQKNITLQVSLVGRGRNKRMVSAGLEREANEEEKLRFKLPATQASDKAQKIMFPFLHGQYGSEGSRRAYRDFVYSMTYKDAIEQAAGVFNNRWLMSHVAAVQENTPGVCVIKGWVDCIGTRGKYRLEVEAYYLPSDDSFVGIPRITEHYVIVNIAKWKQQGGSGMQQQRMPPVPKPQSPMPEDKQSSAEPSTPTEKPSPGKDAGK